ncbi:MAG TPA: hypothetical protein VH328_10750 [Burkholderiaceae bacterium]|nr:hypothetical protein [Burkholderiaceae bacterium]
MKLLSKTCCVSFGIARALPRGRALPARPTRALLIGGCLMTLASIVHAQTSGGDTFSFPIVDSILCGFWAYSKTRLAPMIAAIVVLFSVVGQWLGHGRMWSVLLYIGLGLGIILGIGALIAAETGAGASCLAS